MRNIIYILLLTMLAVTDTALAIKWEPVPCDSTSYIYSGGVSAHGPFQPFWEKLLPAQEPVYQPSASDAIVSIGAEAPKRVLFNLPPNYLNTPNPEYKTFKHDKLEYYSRLGADKTSFLYMRKSVSQLTFSDSLTMFLPLDIRNLGNYTLKSFGIEAKYIDYRLPAPDHFHIDLSKQPIHEKFPWQVIVPLMVSVLLLLISRYFQPEYFSRLFLIIFYSNTFNNSVRERNVNADKSAFMLFVNYLVNATLLATILLYRYNYQFSVDFLVAYITMLLVVMAVYWVKRIVSWMLAYLFDYTEAFDLHYRSLSYLLQALGIVLVVTNALSLYINMQGVHDMVFYTTIVGCAVIEILKIFRLFKIIIDKHFSYFYLFLYLCAVEFLPVALVVKALSH